ncbi:MAG: 3-hydroxyisobutyrate dehydrogenase-like beta-hydroxyacid dehydrogenase [Myxococcota bacterium]|jgi:3-hydroxyisobutyrate dehydrogenase-like beta-hydroxyacid dehydrogenase
MKHAIIGTGLIGTGIGLAALERGDAITAYNRTASKTKTLADAGANIASTVPRAVTGALFVHLALTADDAVDAVLAQMIGHLHEEAIVLDHSTTLPERTRERAIDLAAKGIRFLHAPVFMSPVAAKNATGIIMVSGPQGLYNEATDALSRMTGHVWYVGEDPGAAATLKLCGNAMILAMMGGLADGHSIATNNGLTPNDVTKLFKIFNPTNTLNGRGQRMADADYETQWSVKMARKDLGLMVEAAGDRPLTVLPALGACMDTLIADGDGDHDLAILGKSGQ